LSGLDLAFAELKKWDREPEAFVTDSLMEYKEEKGASQSAHISEIHLLLRL
jgi:hypothetical protein